MRSVLALAGLELRRFLADKFNLFFVFVLPLMLVAVLGLQSGQSPEARIGLLAGSATGSATSSATGTDPTTGTTDSQSVLTRATDHLEKEGVEVTTYGDRDALDLAVGEGSVDLGMVISATEPLGVELVSVGDPHPVAQALASSAADALAVEQARGEALTRAGADQATVDAALAGPDGWQPAQVEVTSTSALGEAFAGASRFEVGASGQLLLFVFLNTLAASAATIQARRSGAIKRGLAAPVTAGQTVSGMALGRLVIALFQAGWIVGMSSLLFGVQWGSLLAVAVVIAIFGLIAAGFALVIGVIMDAEGPASGLSVGGGLVLAAIGGCMVPLEFFSDGLRQVALLTPHAWGYEALAEITRRGGGLGDVLPQLGVLAAMAVAVLALGAYLMRRSLQRAM
ncbi:ABC transporter permease [Ornithinimicrobium sp. Y1847]|uniref:ABC transporter permease n=1 Tax=Ornithinimicrobium sp. Y1847 TaxID=3405419 RepID=UPI003B681B5D